MSLNTEKLTEMLEKIENSQSSSESACSKLADEFEDELMGLGGFPTEHFELITTILSATSLYKKPGIWNFLMVLGSQRHRLTPYHFEQLHEIFIQNYLAYEDEDLCLAICDFVARNFDKTRARSLLEALKKIELNKPVELRGIVDEGFIILSKEIARDGGRQD